ncbi:FAD-dependent oxidoreductase, partial [Klebsiella pneumoniae]|uniref:FAD-dependent oxidoreductase n=1 Tax=Klebsiella pneumoniae TaxID=573 RepID=UPI00210C9656
GVAEPAVPETDSFQGIRKRIQIGLLPNTTWLEGAVERNRMGEIIIDAKCETNVKGVFAAGDCTTVPYKQIIIAAGPARISVTVPLNRCATGSTW